METQNNRRKWLLATVLALLGAATLCVWGVAAAGVRFSSPPLEAAIQAFKETRTESDRPGTGSGDVNISVPGDGNGSGNGNGEDNGNGNGNDGNGGNGNGGNDGNGGTPGADANCFLGLLCLDARVNTASTSADGAWLDVNANSQDGGLFVNADVNAGETQRCFLGLLCIHSTTDASLAPIQAQSDSTLLLNTPLLNNTVLDVNADADLVTDAQVNVDAQADLSGRTPSLLDNLLNLFVNIN